MREIKTYSKGAPFYNAFERSRRAADAAREVKVGLVACGLR
jgi:hypothetical protein